jgi:hypothetical protein
MLAVTLLLLGYYRQEIKQKILIPVFADLVK